MTFAEIEVPTAAGSGAAYFCGGLTNKWIQIVNATWTGSLVIEGSINGSTFAPLYSYDFTAEAYDVLKAIPMPLQKLRVRVVTDTSGTEPTVSIGGELV